MARDVLRDQSRGDEKDEAATAETGAAAEEGAALEAGGRAPAKAAAAAAASPERAPTTTNLKPSAYAYDLFLCVRFLLWSERERERQRRETRKGERSSREKRNRKRRKNSLLLSPPRHLAQQGISMVAAGVMGLPPTNGVLPQAPMHTLALSVSLRLLFPSSFLGSRPATISKGKKLTFFSFSISLQKPGRRGRAS